MENNKWYYLDPDNRKTEPTSGLFCCRCKRPIKETQCFESFISVEKHPEHPWVRTSVGNGKHIIGKECAKKLEEVWKIK